MGVLTAGSDLKIKLFSKSSLDAKSSFGANLDHSASFSSDPVLRDEIEPILELDLSGLKNSPYRLVTL